MTHSYAIVASVKKTKNEKKKENENKTKKRKDNDRIATRHRMSREKRKNNRVRLPCMIIFLATRRENKLVIFGSCSVDGIFYA